MGSGKLSLCGVIVWLCFWSLIIPTSVCPTQAVTPPTSTSGLGPSVDITYEIPARFSEPAYFPSQLRAPHLSYETGALVSEIGSIVNTYVDDGYYYGAIYDADQYLANYYVHGYFAFDIITPYTDVATFYYEWSTATESDDGAIATDNSYLCYVDSDGTLTQIDSDTGGNGKDSSSSSVEVINGKLSLVFYVNYVDNSDYELVFKFDELRLTFNDVEETVRTDYEVLGGAVRYEGVSQCLLDAVNFTLAVPSDWSFQYVTPNCSRTSSDEFYNTAPATYSWVYTCDALATANWQQAYSNSFESTGNEYVEVLDGSASLDITTNENLTESWAGAVWVVWSAYGSITFQWASGNLETAGTAGQWTTTLTHCDSVDYLYFNATAGTLDAVTVYNSSVVEGSTITGTTRHIHPNGYTAAPYVDVELGLWDASYDWQEYQTVTTDSDGDWSFDTDDFSTSFTAQTYQLWTWVYCDANGYWDVDTHTEAITDWSCTLGVSQTERVSTDAHEGVYSVEGYDHFDTTSRLFFTHNPSGTWSLGDIPLLYLWLKLNDTTAVDPVFLFGYVDTDTHYYYDGVLSDYGFSVNTWVQVVIPLTDNYLSKGNTPDPSIANYFRIYFDNTTNTDVCYSVKVDSFNYMEKYTSDTLTYPFSAPADWSLTGTFSFSDVYGHCFVTTNYDASYSIYENDTYVAGGSVTADEDNIRWSLDDTNGAHIDVGINFNYHADYGSKWVNTSYDNAAAEALKWQELTFTMDDWYVHITVFTNWRNGSVTITDLYEGVNTTQFTGANEGTFDYKFTEWGEHTVYVEVDCGADTISKTFTYEARRDYPDEPLQGLPQQLMAQSAFTALCALLILCAIAAFAVSWRNSRKRDMIISLPEDRGDYTTKRGSTTIERPHRARLKREHDTYRKR